ncbi:MAG: PAS domain S-box protein [Geothrix sp.]|nr:PAS domain S-box protein [Geothrix sp.]
MTERVEKLGRRAEWLVPALFALFSGLWIYVSNAPDHATSLSLNHPQPYATYQDVAYVLISTILLFLGIRAALRRERKEAKKALEAQRFTDLIIQSVQEGVIVYGPDLRYQVWNPFMEQLSGIPAKAVIGKHPMEVFPFLQDTGIMDRLKRALAGELVGSMEFPFHVQSTGRKGWNIEKSVPFRNAQGDIIGVIATVTDITQRRQAEDKLNHSHDLMRYIIEHNQGAVAVHDRDMKYIFVSQRYLQDYKVEGQDLIGRHHYEVMPDLPQKWRDVHQKALAGVISSADSDEWVRGDGTVEWTRWECRPWYEADGSIGGIIVYTELISERKQAQAVLLTSEAKYRTLIDNLSTGLVVHGPDSSILLANGMASALLGLSKEQMLGKTAVDPEWRFLQEDGSPLPLEGYPVNRVLASGEGFKGLVIGVCRPDRAAPTWVLGNAYAVKDAAGQIAEVVVTFGDITALKQTEAALRESEERWKFAIEGAGDGLWDWNVQNGKAYYSARYKEMYGYTEADFGTSSDEWSKRIHPDDAPGVFATLQPYLEGRPGCVTVEFRMLCKDGSWRWTLGRGMVVQHDDDGKPLRMIGTNSDITERRQAEVERVNLQNQLLHSQKMESLGTLAGGVAHDMNNVLGAILGLASAHIGTQPYGSPLHQALDTICKATERGGKMVKSLLSFARQSPAENNKLDMNAVLREQINLLERTTLAKVRLVVDLEAKLRPILGDSSALTHAFMNLCVNAVDAMPETGTLTLHTRNVDNDWIEVVVEDNGMGMSKEVLEKAMEPFFTTKETGKGTGLGLSMVFSTVKAHQGQMAIESEPGKGTRVRLRFPACAEEAPVQAAATAGHEADQIPRGTLNVLLVDDDDLIQSSVQIILDALGHTAVTAAQSGEEGLALLQAGLEPDLVILDMNMPGLGGIGTLPLLRRLRPEVPVLLSTGRADQSALALASTYPGVTLLSKPFGLRELQKHLELIGLG